MKSTASRAAGNMFLTKCLQGEFSLKWVSNQSCIYSHYVEKPPPHAPIPSAWLLTGNFAPSSTQITLLWLGSLHRHGNWIGEMYLWGFFCCSEGSSPKHQVGKIAHAQHLVTKWADCASQPRHATERRRYQSKIERWRRVKEAATEATRVRWSESGTLTASSTTWRL